MVPIMLQAMTELAKERPENPILFVVEYLRKHQEGDGGKKGKGEED